MNEQDKRKFTIIKLLQSYGLDTTKRLAVMRHQASNIKELYKNGAIEVYQSAQGKVNFDCDYVIVFIADENTKAKFIGVYEVKGKIGLYKDNQEYLRNKFGVKFDLFHKLLPEYSPMDKVFDLEEVKGFDIFKDRVIVEWGKNGNYVKHWYNLVKGLEQDKEIIEILPSGKLRREFTDFLDFYLEFDELQDIIGNPDSNKVWHTMLSSVFGIYLILDKKTGKQYIGSASGQDGGILGRWKNYAKAGQMQEGHGGNKELVELLNKEGLDYCKNFRFSILQTVSKSRSKSEVNNIEELYKEKFGSKQHGYNS